MKIIIGIILAVLLAGGGFFAGMKYQQSQVTTGASSGARGTFSRTGLNGASGMTVGQVVSADSQSITVKLSDGSSKIVIVPDAAAISKSAQGVKTDLQDGITVGVFGTTNSDGSITAQNIQINPQLRANSASRKTSPSPTP